MARTTNKPTRFFYRSRAGRLHFVVVDPNTQTIWVYNTTFSGKKTYTPDGVDFLRVWNDLLSMRVEQEQQQDGDVITKEIHVSLLFFFHLIFTPSKNLIYVLYKGKAKVKMPYTGVAGKQQVYQPDFVQLAVNSNSACGISLQEI